jgi:acyl CoA:acetate/3-ketoacid CoA transferase beta subunit
VITDKAIFGFDPESRKMTILSIHPGNTVEDVVGSMGFGPLVPAKVPFTEPPEARQLQLIRETIDPDRMYMG